MYLFQKIENSLELYSMEQGSQTVDIKKSFVLKVLDLHSGQVHA